MPTTTPTIIFTRLLQRQPAKERETAMQTYPIPTQMYKGAGDAIAAIRDGQVVELKMLDEYPEPSLSDIGRKIMTTAAARLLRAERGRRKAQLQLDLAKQLAPAGEVLIGVASGHEFCVTRSAQ